MLVKQFRMWFLVALLVSGCQQSKPVSSEAEAKREEIPTSEPAPQEVPVAPQPRRAVDSVVDDYEQRREEYSQRAKEEARARAGTTEDVLIGQVGDLLRDSMQHGKVLVVWIVDCTANNDQQRSNATRAINNLYADLTVTAVKNPEAGSVATGLVALGRKEPVVIDEPTIDYDQVTAKLARLSKTNSEEEPIFTAIGDAIDRYASYRKNGGEVYVVVVTNEAGDDQELNDTVIAKAKRLAIPIYVLGAPAMFGRRHSQMETSDRVVQGPESKEVERIQLEFFDGDQTNDVIDSGFGPYELERLCRATGGTYLALRPGGPRQELSLRMRSSDWPDPLAPRFESKVMRTYRPQYGTQSAYQEMLNTNASCQALHDAGKLPPLRFTKPLIVDFKPKDQADLVRKVNEAQKEAARLTRPLTTLHETLRSGLPGRKELTVPRWQAGYDLALGRATAAKTRIQGYNEMLAALKRDGTFQQPGSTSWHLEPAETTEMSSSVDKLAKTTKQYLEAVITDHAGTPWAFIAKQELQTPLGWKWVER